MNFLIKKRLKQEDEKIDHAVQVAEETKDTSELEDAFSGKTVDLQTVHLLEEEIVAEVPDIKPEEIVEKKRP